MIRLDEKTKSYEVSFSKRHPITRRSKSLRRKGIKTKAEAERVYRELVYIVSKSFEDSKPSKKKYKEVLRLFGINLNTRELAPATIENYMLCLNAHTLEKWGNRDIGSFLPQEIKDLIRVDLADRSFSHQKSVLKFIRGVFTFAHESGMITSNPVPKMQFRIGRKLKPVLNKSQAKLLVKKAWEYNHEWAPIWETALYTGLRNEELYPLRWCNVDLENRKLYVREVWTKKGGFVDLTKTGEDRIAEIAEPLVKMLTRLKEHNPDTPFVLPRIGDWDSGRQAEILRIFLLGLGLPRMNFHGLRATWATMMLANGVELAKVMRMGGWKSLKTLNDHYLRLSGVDIEGATDSLNLESEDNKRFS
jgi:integrase